MEIKSNKINGANAEISATISMDEVNANIEKIAKQLAKTTSVQGFRKGKVPVAIVKKQYGEKLVQDAINKLMANRTTLVIAHRLSTVQNADHILVVKNGQIAEEGTHAELLAKAGVYKNLVDLQTL